MERRRSIEEQVEQHYSQPGLEKTILDALEAAGKDLDHLTTVDLAPVDENHTGGREATVELARLLAFEPGMRLLDVGCGIGGASRYFAEHCGCHVTGVDVTNDFVRVAETLARRVGLSDRVSYRHASALELPFPAACFDGGYMMHVGMNVDDKLAMFTEIRRVLKRGAVFGVYDVVRREGVQIGYPLPCAFGPETAFVADLAAYHRSLGAAGFEIVTERDRLDEARAFFSQAKALATGAAERPPLGLHLLFKGREREILENVAGLFERGDVAPIEIACRVR